MPNRVRVSHGFAHPPSAVFDAWLEPKQASQFLFATATGTIVKAEIDARIGGRFEIVDRRPDEGDIHHVGTFVDLDRPYRIAFDFSVESSPITRVMMAISPNVAGAELILLHEGVPAEMKEKTEAGWRTILEGLSVVLNRPSST